MMLARRIRRALLRARVRLRRLPLASRILLVFGLIVTTSTALSLILQDRSLAEDLRKAARTRLERTAALAGDMLADRLQRQAERYRAIAGTPQFIANLEVGHVPTLAHFAAELARQQRASAIQFLDGSGREVAGAGDALLRDAARAAFVTPGKDPAPDPSSRQLVAWIAPTGVPFALVALPMRDLSKSLGTLLCLEAIEPAQLAEWSALLGAKLTFGPPSPNDPLSLAVRPVGALQFRVATSFDAEREALENSRRNLLTTGVLGLALALGASLFLARSLVRPIHAIRTAAERIADGELGFRVESFRRDEVGQVARAINVMLERLEQNVTERIRAENHISDLAYHDSLTGLANRRLLKQHLGLALAQAQEHGTRVAVIFLDLDRFKGVNDALGHAAGDELLIEVARRLDGCLRTADAPESAAGAGVQLARLGGDEFTMLVHDVADRRQVERLADRILDSLVAPYEIRGQILTLSASLGIAIGPDDANDVDTLLRESDMAMFHAKNQGGRKYEFYADSMQALATKRLALEAKLQRALDNDEFELRYQPKLDLQTDRVTGFEALLRWRNAEQGIVGPDEFIPMAEEIGAIVPIGEWVLYQAIEQSLAWQAQGLPPVRIAVNVSVRQIEHHADFVLMVANLLEATGFDPKLLELEITEGALLRDVDAAIALLKQLRQMGIGLALDDFGTGYSSLSYLRRLPISTLKIDRSFIQGADVNPEDAALVGSIIAMAKVLGLRVIVEGVETRRQRRFLEALGCDEIQGFLFSQPVGAEAAAEILRRSERRRRRRQTAEPAPRVLPGRDR